MSRSRSNNVFSAHKLFTLFIFIVSIFFIIFFTWTIVASQFFTYRSNAADPSVGQCYTLGECQSQCLTYANETANWTHVKKLRIPEDDKRNAEEAYKKAKSNYNSCINDTKSPFTCDGTDKSQCGPNQVCDISIHKCRTVPGCQSLGGSCQSICGSGETEIASGYCFPSAGVYPVCCKVAAPLSTDTPLPPTRTPQNCGNVQLPCGNGGVKNCRTYWNGYQCAISSCGVCYQ